MSKCLFFRLQILFQSILKIIERIQLYWYLMVCIRLVILYTYR